MKSSGEPLEDDSGYPITFCLLKWKGHQNVCSCEANEQDGLQDACWDCCLVWNFNLHQRANCKGYLLKLMMLLLFPFHGGQDCGWGNCPCLNICVAWNTKCFLRFQGNEAAISRKPHIRWGPQKTNSVGWTWTPVYIIMSAYASSVCPFFFFIWDSR